MTDIVERLKASHSMLGDPLHREAWEEIERLRKALNQIIAEMEYEPGNGDIALRIAKQAMEGK